MPRNLILASIVSFSIGVGLLIETSGRPYWALGFFPAVVLLTSAYFFLLFEFTARMAKRGVGKWTLHYSRMLQEGKEPRWKDETIVIPPQSMKDYPVKLGKRDSIDVRAFSYSEPFFPRK